MAAEEIVSKTLGAALLVIIAAAFAFHFVDQRWLTCPHNTTATDLARPFASVGGFGLSAAVPQLEDASDIPDNPARSRYVVCEGSQLIGRLSSIHADIAAIGKGRFSHWGKDFIFSASDNSNRNTNGRRYVAVAAARLSDERVERLCATMVTMAVIVLIEERNDGSTRSEARLTR